jgi:transcriptional regulator with XRE-family HTH domain
MTVQGQFASLPLQPLWDLARAKADEPDGLTATGALGFTAARFAEMVGTTPRAVSRWRREGRIPWVSADEAAIRLGYHPVLVWGDDWLNVKGDFDALCAEAWSELEDALAAEIADEALDGDWT